MSDSAQATEITRQSGSNLALAFVLLPRERREDITCFYAFCRLIDDLVDEPDRPLKVKEEGLRRWREQLFQTAEPDASQAQSPELAVLVPEDLARGIRGLIQKYRIPPEHFEELIRGVEMDLAPARFADWEALRAYCYRVASVVGLISVEIFGYRNPRSRDYAVELGYALQLTNIIRDVAKDARNDGRIYLPQDALARHGVTEAALLAGTPEPGLAALLAEQTRVARALYLRAQELMPREDRRSLIAAELMGRIYSQLLDLIAADGFRVFEREYRLNKGRKILTILRVYLSKYLGF